MEEKMKKTISMIFSLACLLVLFAGCSVSSGSFNLKMSEMTYGAGNDKVRVEAVSDDSNANVRKVKCWWTFDGTEPTKDSHYTNTNDDEISYDFDMVIPSDFYSGKIRLLCEIEYSAYGKRKTVTKEFEENFSTKYHSLSGSSTVPLAKGRGYQKEYFIGTTSSNASITYEVKENGVLKIQFLQGSGLFKVGAGSIGSNETSFSKNVSQGDSVSVSYHSDIVATTSAASGTKSAEYLIVLE